jgi:hypothetical protein
MQFELPVAVRSWLALGLVLVLRANVARLRALTGTAFDLPRKALQDLLDGLLPCDGATELPRERHALRVQLERPIEQSPFREQASRQGGPTYLVFLLSAPFPLWHRVIGCTRPER